MSSNTDPLRVSARANPTPVSTTPTSTSQQVAVDDANRQNHEMTNVPKQHANNSDEAAAAWGRCAKVLHGNDKSLLRGWKDEIDTLLVFAGLFSAVLTTFNAQSYQLLQPDPADASVALLMQISTQLNSFTVNRSFINSTHPASLNPQTTFQVPSYAVRVNVLWFSSLIFSLASASIGILVKQWLNQYSHGLIGTSHSRETARLRQYRYESLVKWRILAILTLLPLLLQIALALLLVGLVDLLWNIHHAVATAATVLVAVLLLSSTFTIILPSFYRDCFYKSPQALGFFLIIQQVLRMWRASCHVMLSFLDVTWISSLAIHINLCGFYSVRTWFYEISQGRTYYSWREQERESVRKLESVLDSRILTACDAIKMDDEFLETTIEPCFYTVDIAMAVSCYDDILRHRADHLDNLRWTWTHSRGTKAVNSTLSLGLCVLERLDPGEQQHLKDQLHNDQQHQAHILDLLAQLWTVGGSAVEYPVTARLLNSLVEMFPSRNNEVVFKIIRQACAVRGILPSIAHNAQIMDALLKDPDGTALILDVCLAGLAAATSENPSSDDDGERQNRIRHILCYVRQYVETTGYKHCDVYWFLRQMKDLCRKILLVAQIFPRSIAAPGELAAVLWTAVEAKILEDGGRSARRDGGVISDALWIMASLETTGTQPQARVDSTFVAFCSESLQAATSESSSSNDDERGNRIRHILSYLRQYIETVGYKYCHATTFVFHMRRLCRKILLVAQTFPGSIEAPDELVDVLRKAIEAIIPEVNEDTRDELTGSCSIISDTLWIVAAPATISIHRQAREHLDVDSTFVSFCSESLEAATSENPSSSVEERRNCIRHILSYLRQYIETSGYKYRDAYLFLRDMEDLCKKIFLAAQTLPGSIAAPDKLAAMFRTAIEAKLDDDDDLNFVMRHNKRTVLDYLSTIEALVTTQPRVSAGSQGEAQVDWTGPSPSSLLREEAVVRSETHKEPSNLTGTSSQQLHQFIVEGEFGGEEEQTASWSSSL